MSHSLLDEPWPDPNTVTIPVRLFDDYFDADDSHDRDRISDAKYALFCAAYHMCPDCGEHDGNHSESCMAGG